MNDRQLLHIFLGIWFVINLIQAFFLDLTPDEAYYFVYAQNLAWGYFDHPPMIAALIKVGYALIANEVGVRLLSITMSTLALYLLWKMAAIQSIRLFLMTILSVGGIHLMSFHALPDVPLIFFTILYLYVVQQYLNAPSWLNAFGIAGCVVGLMLSKYHGILVLFFTILAHPTLLLKRHFWGIALMTTVGLLPHFLWQYNHDFPSLTYHLVERNAAGYSILNSLKYMALQPLVAGPLIGFWLLYGAWKHQNQTIFDGILSFILWGTYVFFLVSSFRGEVLLHWTAIALVPLIIKALRYFDSIIIQNLTSPLFKQIQWVFGISLMVVTALRVLLVYDFIPQFVVKHEALQGWSKWAQQIQQRANQRPVIFTNSYIDASRYWFYAKSPSFSYNNVAYRRNQYDLMDLKYQPLEQPVCFLSDSPQLGFDTLYLPIGKPYYSKMIDTFVAFPSLQISTQQSHYQGKPNESLSLSVKTKNLVYPINLLQKYPAYFTYHIYQNKELIAEKWTTISILSSLEDWSPLEIQLPRERGHYILKIGIVVGALTPTHNSTTIELICN